MSDQEALRRLLHHAPPAAPADPAPPIDDTTYLKLWELEQAHTNVRWTVATFFLSVSFAIFGFSFQAQLAPPLPLVARVSALTIYWFAYLLFQRFNRYTRFLRGYLRDLERAGRTTLDVQTRAERELADRALSTKRLLVIFGLLYSIGVALLAWLAP